MLQITENLYLFQDTCNVYVIRSGNEAVLIDFGSGDVLDHLPEIDIERVTDILMTHHHRDQGQGLARAVEAGIRIWVPYTEEELFCAVDVHWQGRTLYNNYDMRQDRFSLLEPVKIAGTLRDYTTCEFGTHSFIVVPTPGHTVGSISLFSQIDGQLVAFTGDLIAAPGKVWSLAATQWTYNGGEGLAVSIPSLLDVKARRADLLLPSHGKPISEPDPAIDLLIERLRQLMDYRQQNRELPRLLENPFVPITPHLLWNQASIAFSYVLLSESGKALVIDYGYDFAVGIAASTERTARRPWLYSLNTLKQKYGVQKIDVAIPTHFHDDHVAGLNLLREFEGAQIWAACNFSDVLERPAAYDLPCLWYEPIPVSRSLPLGEPIQWEEYTFTLDEQPGHTLYAVAIAVEVDGKRVLAIGDQFQGKDRVLWNYVYENRFQIGDYRKTAALYRKIRPDVLLSGHDEPFWVNAHYLDVLDERGAALERLHKELLPLETLDLDAEGFIAWIHPYQPVTSAGEQLEFEVEVRNPFSYREKAVVRIAAPAGWKVAEPEQNIPLDANATSTVKFHVNVPAGVKVRRARIAADLTVGGQRFGQQAEALVTVV